MRGESRALASIQHVYRRGAIYWWRRTHVLGDKSRVETRLSLRTANPKEARLRSAALAAGTAGVLELMGDIPFKDPTACPTMDELQKMAKAAYDQILSRFIAQQRSEPSRAAEFSLSNRTSADVYGYLHSNGGKFELAEADRANLVARGWDDDRIKRLREALEHANQGNFPISLRTLDYHLREYRYWPHNGLRRMVLGEFYPAYRDACLAAEAELQGRLNGTVGTYSQADSRQADAVDEAQETEALRQQSVGAPCRPESTASTTVQPASPWLAMTPKQVADALIEEKYRSLSHRAGGPRGGDIIDEHTLRQIRWAAKLLESCNKPGMPLAGLNRSNLEDLDKLFEGLPKSAGKSQKHHTPEFRLADLVAETAENLKAGKIKKEAVGLTSETSNKHYAKMKQLHEFLRTKETSIQPVNFTGLKVRRTGDVSKARAGYSLAQGKAIFTLPPWTGCRAVGLGGSHFEDRATLGDEVYHDAFYFVMLLTWYTAARREEICKLMVSEVFLDDTVPYISIEHSITGRLKNDASVRKVPIADELLRLGFDKYVRALKREGEWLLFPELASENSENSKFGGVFLKHCFERIEDVIPDRQKGQALHSMRHTVANSLKQQGFSLEFRNDLLGHSGKSEGEARYVDRAVPSVLLDMVNAIPIVTDHLPTLSKIALLPAALRKPRPARDKDVQRDD